MPEQRRTSRSRLKNLARFVLATSVLSTLPLTATSDKYLASMQVVNNTATAPLTGDTITTVTANMHGFRGDVRKGINDLIQAYHPNVILTQEVTQQGFNNLIKDNGDYSGVFAPNNTLPGGIVVGNAVFSLHGIARATERSIPGARYLVPVMQLNPLGDVTYVSVPQWHTIANPRTTLSVEIPSNQADGSPVTFTDAHLSYDKSDNYDQVQVVLDRATSSEFVAGDFNTRVRWPSIILHDRPIPVGIDTWDDRPSTYPANDPIRRVDEIFPGSRYREIQDFTVDIGSDHLAVVSIASLYTGIGTPEMPI